MKSSVRATARAGRWGANPSCSESGPIRTRPVIQRHAGSSIAQLQTRPRDSERLQATPEPLSFGDSFGNAAQAPTGH
jgi:hypothetical protein